MDKLIVGLKKLLPSRRRIIQLYAALLYNAHIKGFIKGNIYTGKIKAVCVPGLNCYSCPGAVGACPLGALQNALAASSARTPLYVLGILLLFGITFGRTICGYLCPVGLLQDLAYKIPVPKVRKSPVTRALSYLKYALLIVFVIYIPLAYASQSYPLPGFCKYICPAGTLEGALGLLSHPDNADMFSMLGALFTEKMLILIVLVLSCVFVYRAFCRFICPLGAIYGLFNRFSIIGVKVDNSACTDCGKCIGVCKMDAKKVGDHECIQCGECMSVCPVKAITVKAGKIRIAGPDINENGGEGKAENSKKKKISFKTVMCLLMAVVLIAVLTAVNLTKESAVPDEIGAVQTSSGEKGDLEIPALETGKEIGNLAPDFTVPVYGGEDYRLYEQRGKITIVNFWATWCGPCCQELEYFDRIYTESEGKISVIAVHSNLITDDVEKYLGNYSYKMPFGLDESGSVIKSFGGSTMLPMTVVINKDGLITYNKVGSLTYEELKAIAEAAEQ